SEDHLHRSAYATALDFYRQLWGRRYAVSGSAAFSHVVGTRKALIATQLASARYFQRPNTNEFDSTRTSLSGSAVRLSVSKISGVLSLDASYARLSPGYEVNDVGFEPIVDQQSWTLT